MREHGTGDGMIRLELKYCEGCGGLLLRRANEAVVYCTLCAKALSELPAVRREKKRSSKAKAPVGRTVPCGEGCGTPADVGYSDAPRKQPQSVRLDVSEERRLG